MAKLRRKKKRGLFGLGKRLRMPKKPPKKPYDQNQEKGGPSRKQKAQRKARIVLKILLVITVINLIWALVGFINGQIGRSRVVEEFGGKKAMSEMSEADLERPYFAYINGKMDKAKNPVTKTIGFINNIGCMVFLWGTCTWHWGVVGTVWFTLALWWELIWLVLLGPWFVIWYKISVGKDEKAKAANVKEEMEKAAIREAKQKEQEEAERLNDPTRMTREEIQEKIRKMRLQKQAQQWGEPPHNDD